MNPKDNKNTIVIYNINCVYRSVVSLNLMDKKFVSVDIKAHETFSAVTSFLSKYTYKVCLKFSYFKEIS